MSKQPPVSLARRLLPAVAITTTASGLVALLDRPSSGAAVESAGDAAAASDQASAAPAVTVSVTPTTITTQPPAMSSTQPVPTVAPLVPAAQQQPVATDGPSPADTASASAGACDGPTVDGATVQTKWGPVQVQGVVSAQGQICDVGVIQSPNSHRKSVRINDRALPILHDEVLQAQSATISSVSGATITSRAYKKSLQSILDGAG